VNPLPCDVPCDGHIGLVVRMSDDNPENHNGIFVSGCLKSSIHVSGMVQSTESVRWIVYITKHSLSCVGGLIL
jgi:hypothetical protein